MRGFLLIICLLLASCTVGPDYHRPGVTLPAKFKEAKGKSFRPLPKAGWTLAAPKDIRNPGLWWKIFQDPELDALEDQLNHYNQNIANAMATYNQSVDIVYQARAAYWPTVVAALTSSDNDLAAAQLHFSLPQVETQLQIRRPQQR